MVVELPDFTTIIAAHDPTMRRPFRTNSRAGVGMVLVALTGARHSLWCCAVTPHLHGFGVAGYRSFGAAELERVSPMSTVHLVAGPNRRSARGLVRRDVHDSSDEFWFEFEMSSGSSRQSPGWHSSREQIEDIGVAAQRLGRDWLGRLSSNLAQMSGGQAGDDEKRILEKVVSNLRVAERLPPVAFIDAFRQITPTASDGAAEQHG